MASWRRPFEYLSPRVLTQELDVMRPSCSQAASSSCTKAKKLSESLFFNLAPRITVVSAVGRCRSSFVLRILAFWVSLCEEHFLNAGILHLVGLDGCTLFSSCANGRQSSGGDSVTVNLALDKYRLALCSSDCLRRSVPGL